MHPAYRCYVGGRARMPTIGPRYMHAIHTIHSFALKVNRHALDWIVDMMGITKFFFGFLRRRGPCVFSNPYLVIVGSWTNLCKENSVEAHKMYVCSYVCRSGNLCTFVWIGRFLPRRESPLAKHGKGKPYWNICREKSLFFIKVL